MAKFRILSLDGGGIRGVFGAAFLAAIEEQLGRGLGVFFDLVAGTSTGGIIGSGIAARVPASDVADLYLRKGPAIFTRQPPAPRPDFGFWRNRCVAGFERYLTEQGYPLDMDWLQQAKYGADVLRAALTEVFKDMRISDLPQRLLLPTIALAPGRTSVIKTPHLPDLFRDRGRTLVDAILATTAAPTYFPSAELGGDGGHVDGGLWANNPAMVAYAEAMRIRNECRRPEIDVEFSPDEVHILSIGTGQITYSLQPPGPKAGILWWAPRLLDVMGAAQAQGVYFQCRNILGARQIRIDYQIPDKGWTLDRVDLIEALATLGRDQAHQHLAALMPIFFDRPALEYTPFQPPGAGGS